MVSVLKDHVSVEGSNIIKTQKSSPKYIIAVFILPVYPPRKIEQQFLKHTFKKRDVGTAVYFFIDIINAESRPCVYGRIYITEIPLIGRQLAVRMDIPFLGEQAKLVFCELRINKRKGHTVKCKIPGCEPRVFPFVRHGDNVLVLHVFPFAVPHMSFKIAVCFKLRISFQPFGNIIMVELFVPQKSCKSLPLYVFFVFGGNFALKYAVILIGLKFTLLH